MKPKTFVYIVLLINYRQLKCENMHSVFRLFSIAILRYKRTTFLPKLCLYEKLDWSACLHLFLVCVMKSLVFGLI